MPEYKCPNCGSPWVRIKAIVSHCPNGSVSEDGFFEFDELSWDSQSPASCSDCGYPGKAGDFEVKKDQRGWEIKESRMGVFLVRDTKTGLFPSDEEALEYVCRNYEQAKAAIEELLTIVNSI